MATPTEQGVYDSTVTMCREVWHGLGDELRLVQSMSIALIEDKEASRHMRLAPWGTFPDVPRHAVHDYLVTWDINITAESPEEAAQLARDMQLDYHSTATVFEVRDENGDMTPVDLEDTP